MATGCSKGSPAACCLALVSARDDHGGGVNVGTAIEN